MSPSSTATEPQPSMTKTDPPLKSSEGTPTHPMSPPLSPLPPGDSDEVEASDDDKQVVKENADVTPTPSNKPPSSVKRSSVETELTESLAAHTDSISDKRNHDFHALFKSIPEEDNLVENYGCALQKEILVQGRIYISESHLCFNANIFGWVTNFVIAFSDIVEIEKRTTAIFIPNAIQITTSDEKYLFASFLSRDQAFDLMMDVWKYAKSVADQSTGTDASSSSGMISDDEETLSEDEDDADVQVANAPVPPAPAQNQPTEENEKTAPPKTIKQVKEKTECTCGDDHYPNTVLDQVYDGTLESIYSLLYTSGFMKKFLTEDEGLSDVTIGEWQASEDNQHTRSTSYIKPLNGAIGPKQTQCLQAEKVIHYDLVSSVTMLTTTQTPDVPSGGSFEVKTRTCMTWAGPAKVRILVTVLVDFSKSSWIKSTIEKASVDGQVSFYQDLNSAIRHYIKQHPSEFSLDGKHFKGGKGKKRRARKHHHAIEPKKKETEGWVWNQMQAGIGAISVNHLICVCLVLLLVIQTYIATHPSTPNNDALIHLLDDKFKALDTIDSKLKALDTIQISQRTWHAHS